MKREIGMVAIALLVLSVPIVVPQFISTHELARLEQEHRNRPNAETQKALEQHRELLEGWRRQHRLFVAVFLLCDAVAIGVIYLTLVRRRPAAYPQ